MNTLEWILDSVNTQKNTKYAPGSNHAALDEQAAEMLSLTNESKRFLLKVEKSQMFYDEQYLKHGDGNIVDSFILPFPTTLLTFEQPLYFNWYSQEKEEDEKTRLLGMLIKEMGYKGGITQYKAFLFIHENIDGPVPYIGHQYIRFFYSPNWNNTGKPNIIHIDHYPCREKNYCMVDKDGLVKKWAEKVVSDKGFVCQEVQNRDSLIETMLYVVAKINTTIPKIVEKKHYGFLDKLTGFIPRFPSGWPYTEGNLPHNNYTLNLDGIRYKYDPNDIDYGSGTKHRYRYDVRRHPRVVNGRLVWVEPYQRGSGKYIPKVYSNSHIWRVPDLMYMAEKLTTMRIFEIIFIKLIYFFKKRK